MEPLDFKSRQAFEEWLKENHQLSNGQHIFIYKKKFQANGLSYEEAVLAALSYGWIDSVKHSFDQKKYTLYFSKRTPKSKWSISNIKRMKNLIEDDLVKEQGLKYFDKSLIMQLDELIEEEKVRKSQSLLPPQLLIDILNKENMMTYYLAATKGVKKQFHAYMLDAKQEKTKIRRAYKIIGILKGKKNNL